MDLVRVMGRVALGPQGNDFTTLRDRVRSLGREYVHTDYAFPVGHIIDVLERRSEEQGKADAWAVQMLREVGLSYEEIFRHYQSVLESPVRPWQSCSV